MSLLKNKIYLISSGLIILMTTFLIGGYFWRQEQTADPFFEFAPVDSVMYVSVRDSVWPEAKTRIGDLPFKEFFKQTAENEIFSRVDFLNDILAQAKRAALILAPDENLALKQVFIFEFKEPLLLPTNFRQDAIFDQKFLVVAENESVLNKIKQVKNKSMFSLSRRLESKKNSRLFFLYASADNLKSYFKAGGQPLNNFFTRLFNDDLFLALKKKNDTWQLSLSGQATTGRDPSLPVLGDKPLIESLPKNFSYYLSGISLAEIFFRLGQADRGLSDLGRQTQTSFQTIYKKDLSIFISEVLAKPIEAVIFAKNKEYAPGFGLVLALAAPAGDQIGEFEDLARIFLAQKRPAEKERQLLDKSAVTELLAEPDNWQWEEETINGNQKIRFLSEPALAFELAYALKDDKMFLANSRQRLNDFFTEKDLITENLTPRGAGFNPGRFILLNPQTQPPEFLPYLPAGLVLLNENGKELAGWIIGF